jgi:hypothetical protein
VIPDHPATIPPEEEIFMRKSIVLLLILLVVSVMNVQAAPRYVSLYFGDSAEYDGDNDVMDFSVGNTHVRVPMNHMAYFLAQDLYGNLYSIYRVKIQPRDPDSWIIMGLPGGYRSRGAEIDIGSTVDPNGQLKNPDAYRIVRVVGMTSAQMVLFDPK